MNIRQLGLFGCKEVLSHSQENRFTIGISPRALRLGLHSKSHKAALPKGRAPWRSVGMEPSSSWSIGRSWDVPEGGHSAKGSTVQLRVLLAAPSHLLQLIRAVGDVGLTGALPVGWGEAGRQEQALVLTRRLLAQA